MWSFSVHGKYSYVPMVGMPGHVAECCLLFIVLPLCTDTHTEHVCLDWLDSPVVVGCEWLAILLYVQSCQHQCADFNFRNGSWRGGGYKCHAARKTIALFIGLNWRCAKEGGIVIECMQSQYWFTSSSQAAAAAATSQTPLAAAAWLPSLLPLPAAARYCCPISNTARRSRRRRCAVCDLPQHAPGRQRGERAGETQQ